MKSRALLTGVSLTILLACGAASMTWAAAPAPLVLEARIALGEVSGRIDHLTVDLQRRRLFIAELGNDSVGVVDLKSARLLRRLTGLSEPQGVLFVPVMDELYVASGGDGSVRVFRGTDLSPTATIKLGDDADNLRLDALRGHVVAGYGNGGLALIDTASHRALAYIALQGHPESFQLSNDGQRAYVNVPGKYQIAVVDLEARQRLASWPTAELRSNFPMALEAGTELWVAFRSPPRLVRFDTRTGKPTLSFDSCGDSDDVFVDPSRHRVYVICGSGTVEVWEQAGTSYTNIAKLSTASGARTGLFVPELDRLFIATRASVGQPASILVFQPKP
jgi:hypothetical protein